MLQAVLWARFVQLKSHYILAVSPPRLLEGGLCSGSGCSADLSPKDIISNDELGLSLFLQGVYTFPGRPCWTPVCFCPDCFHIESAAFGHANMALNNTPTVV